MQAVIRLRNFLLACWKWALSFRAREWKLADYPIYIRKQLPNPDSPFDNSPRFKFHNYVARVVNWPTMDGFGDSREEALIDLRATFLARKANLAEEGKPLPRPGTNVSIQFASQERVNEHPDLTKDFIHRVLDLPWAFISDESSLWDFHNEESNDALVAKIREVYSVDVSDIEPGNIYQILDRIAQTRPAGPGKP
jgi:predicted RNase H-like HicB family nuclease